MSFVTAGLAVAGVAAMAVPIIIHFLFRQRRKPVQWAAMRFLMDAFRKHRRRLQLEQLLLLAVRCLVLGLLGFALARPLLQQAGLIDTGSGRTVYLVIDNSMTSAARHEDDQTALQRHIDAAIETIESLGASDAVGLVTAARPAEALLSPPSTDHNAVIGLLRELEPTASPADIPASLTLVRHALDDVYAPQQQVLVYLLSEFRVGSADLDAPLPSTLVDLPDNVRLLAAPPAEQPIPNVQVTSIDPVRTVLLPGASDGSGQVTVRLARFGGELDEAVSRVRLESPGLPPIEPKPVRWQPGQSEAAVDFLLDIPITEDEELALSSRIDGDRLPLDDQRFTVLALRDRISVLLVDRRSFMADRSIERLNAGQWMRRALDPTSGQTMEFIEVEPAALSPAELRGADVMLLVRADLLDRDGWPLLRRFIENGGLAIITPPGDAQVHQWVDQLSRQLSLPVAVTKEVVEHQPPRYFADQQPRDAMLRMLSSELADLLRPISVYRTLPVNDAQTTARSMLVFADGSPAVIAATPRASASDTPAAQTGRAAGESAAGNGPQQTPTPDAGAGLVIYLTFAPELEWTNLPTKPLMVPMFQELVRQGLSQIRAQRQAIVGAQHRLGLPATAADLAAQHEADRDIAVLPNGTVEQPLTRPGLYDIRDRADQSLGTLAVNVEPAAGRTQVQRAAAVLSWLRSSGQWQQFQPADITAALHSAERGSPLAQLALLAVLALLVLETLLARWFSHSGRTATTTPAMQSTGEGGMKRTDVGVAPSGGVA